MFNAVLHTECTEDVVHTLLDILYPLRMPEDDLPNDPLFTISTCNGCGSERSLTNDRQVLQFDVSRYGQQDGRPHVKPEYANPS